MIAEHEKQALLRELDEIAARRKERMRLGQFPKLKAQPLKPEPGLPRVGVEVAERVHRQSGERLVEQQARDAESAAEYNRRVDAVMREQAQREWRQEMAQRALDFWMEQRLFAEEAERRFQRELDPYNIGPYGAAPFHRGRGED
jgi:hypothetical protein